MPVECLRYDNRETAERRGPILRDFEQGPQVLLMSRRAGGVGLNITSANVVILCSPWWKKGWEEQAIKRAYRPGQTRAVTAITLFASNCDVEKYKAKRRDRKHNFNTKVANALTKEDDEEVKV